MSKVPVDSNPLSNSASITILLADDSEIVRRVIRQLLATQNEFEIIGEAADFAETIRMTSDLNPEVVILDLHMPDDKDISPEKLKLYLNHDQQVLAISIWNDDENKKLAASLGAAVLLDKMDLATTLVPTIMHLKTRRCAGKHDDPSNPLDA
jgi:DNA-binding NarL/FixJ family response regulator